VTPEQKAAHAVAKAAIAHNTEWHGAAPDDHEAHVLGKRTVETLSAAGLVITDAGRVAELLDANSALVEERRTLRHHLAVANATIGVQGEALVDLRDRLAAAEAARDDAKRQAGEMLPRRIEAERQRDEARRQLPALRLALGLNPEA
jgi:uncharacterized protein involved in exopolysaccharide biosynthesis